MHRVVFEDRGGKPRAGRVVLAVLAASTALAGCMNSSPNLNLPRMPNIGSISETSQHGYVVSPMALEQVPVGSSREQVLIALGTPSTTAQYDGEVFYYISQTRRQKVKFMNPEVIDQRVLAVYFDQKGNVGRIADYGLQDGQVFDFISRTTPTGGIDRGFLQQVFSGGGLGPNPSNIFGGR